MTSWGEIEPKDLEITVQSKGTFGSFERLIITHKPTAMTVEREYPVHLRAPERKSLIEELNVKIAQCSMR